MVFNIPSPILIMGHCRCISTIMASCILDPALAYFPCSGVLHVKSRRLPEDSITYIGIRSIMSRERNELLYSPLTKDCGTCQQLADIHLIG
jgi:hypothetical protein